MDKKKIWNNIWYSIEKNRVRLGYNIKTMAKKAGMLPSVYSDAKARHNDLRLTTLIRITDELGISIGAAVRKEKGNAFMDFVEDWSGRKYEDLPDDCFFKDSPLKGFFPVWFEEMSRVSQRTAQTLFHLFCLSKKELDFYSSSLLKKFLAENTPELFKNNTIVGPERPDAGVVFSENFKKILKEREKRSSVFAREIGVDASILGKYLSISGNSKSRAKSVPRVSSAIRIAEAFGVDIDEMLIPRE